MREETLVVMSPYVSFNLLQLWTTITTRVSRRKTEAVISVNDKQPYHLYACRTKYKWEHGMVQCVLLSAGVRSCSMTAWAGHGYKRTCCFNCRSYNSNHSITYNRDGSQVKVLHLPYYL